MIASEMSSLTLFLRHPTALVVSQVVQYGMGSMILIIAGFKGATIQVFMRQKRRRRGCEPATSGDAKTKRLTSASLPHSPPVPPPGAQGALSPPWLPSWRRS